MKTNMKIGVLTIIIGLLILLITDDIFLITILIFLYYEIEKLFK